MIEWQDTTITLDDLTPWERNPKRIGKKQAERMLELWDRLGQFQTVAIGPGGEVYDGHQRLSTLKAAHGGSYAVKALRAGRELTEKEREELTIAAHVGTTGSWDWDALSGWDVAELNEWGMDDDLLKGWNEDAGNLSLMLASEESRIPDGKPLDDPRLETDRVIEVYCSNNDLLDFERTLNEWGNRATVTVNIS